MHFLDTQRERNLTKVQRCCQWLPQCFVEQQEVHDEGTVLCVCMSVSQWVHVCVKCNENLLRVSEPNCNLASRWNETSSIFQRNNLREITKRPVDRLLDQGKMLNDVFLSHYPPIQWQNPKNVAFVCHVKQWSSWRGEIILNNTCINNTAGLYLIGHITLQYQDNVWHQTKRVQAG